MKIKFKPDIWKLMCKEWKKNIGKEKKNIKLLLTSNIIARCNKFFKRYKYEIKRKKSLNLFQVHNVEDLLKDKMKDINLINY